MDNEISNLCRICMCDVQTPAKYIFNPGVDVMLRNCLSVQVNEHDNLPKVLCNLCYQLIDAFNKFKEKALQNDRQMNEYIDGMLDKDAFKYFVDTCKTHRISDELLQEILKAESIVKVEPSVNGNNVSKLVKVRRKIKRSEKRVRLKRTAKKSTDSTDDGFSDNDKSEKTKSADSEDNWQAIKLEDNDQLEDSQERNGEQEPTDVEKNNYCLICDEKFHLKSMLTRHMTLAHQETPKFPCTVCNLVLSNTRTFKEHMLRHSEPLRECPEEDCDETCDTLRNLVRHVRKVHKYTRKETCDTCGEKFFVVQQVTQHLQKKHLKKEAKEKLCQWCGVSFRNIGKHMLAHTLKQDAQKFNCSQCEKQYKTRKSLWVHVKTAHEARMCHICGDRYYGNNHLLKHSGAYKKQKTSPRKGPVPGIVYTCEICQKTFQTKRRLAAHKSLTHFPKMVTCNLCQKIVRKKNYLKHIRVVHEQMVKAKCTICNAPFKEQFRLKEHMRIHTDERPFSCQYCSRRFRNKNTLKKHVRLHTGEKPYICNICGRGFAQCTPLKSHLRTHYDTQGNPHPVQNRVACLPSSGAVVVKNDE